jgi:DNA polymerase I-like protein with 3'-5' exonuclease and polymerase domains/uracil-DNA glycosylase
MNPNTFLGTRGNREGSIFICAESYGKEEALQGKPLVGATGKELDQILYESNIPLSECFFTNVVNERPKDNNMFNFFYPTHESKGKYELKGLFPHPNVIEGMKRLKEQINAVKPKIIIGLGNYASWALTDNCFNITPGGDEYWHGRVPGGITSWRGSQTYTSEAFGSIPFLPTYHPAATFQVHAWRYMIKHDISMRVPKALNGEWKEPEYDLVIQPSFGHVTTRLLRLLSLLDERPTDVVVDLETSRKRKLISCLGIGWEDKRALCIPFLCSYREGGYWSETEETAIVLLLRRIFNHPNLRLIGHNFLFDIQYIIDQMWVKPRIYFDTMIGQHTLWPGGGNPNDPSDTKSLSQGIQRKALFNCASLYCDHYTYWKDEGKDFDTVGGRDELTGWRYNCKDIVKTFEVYQAEKELLKKLNLEEQFNFQMRVANDEALEMMVKGVHVNKETKKKVSQELTKALGEFDEILTNYIPEEVRLAIAPKASKKDPITGLKTKAPWFTSSAQSKKVFYEYLGINPIYSKGKVKAKDGKRRVTLDKNALPILAQREPIIAPLVEKLEVRRSIGVYNSTFAESQEEPDGRLRCSYNVTGTDTFRFSSSENIYDRGGNFQNIPSGKEDDAGLFNFPNMRTPFEPDVGYEIAEFDLSGADATVVAWEAEDEGLKQAFREGKKIHLVNTRTIFGHETRNMTDEEIKAGSGIPGSFYDSVKKGVHATNYGAEPPTLAYRLRWTEKKSIEFQERWFSAHPGIKNWQARTDRFILGLQCWKCQAMSQGGSTCKQCGTQLGRGVSNKFGYRIIFFDHMKDLKKKALAWQPQSTVAINCNKGAIALRDNVPAVQLLLQVHDSLVVQYPIKLANSIPADIKKALHSVSVPYSDPLTIQWSFKASRKSWGEAEKVDW